MAGLIPCLFQSLAEMPIPNEDVVIIIGSTVAIWRHGRRSVVWPNSAPSRATNEESHRMRRERYCRVKLHQVRCEEIRQERYRMFVYYVCMHLFMYVSCYVCMHLFKYVSCMCVCIVSMNVSRVCMYTLRLLQIIPSIFKSYKGAVTFLFYSHS